MEPTHEDERTLLFGNKEVRYSTGMEEGIMHPNDPLHKMGTILAYVYKQHLGEASTGRFANNREGSIVREDGYVSIDAVALSDGTDLQDMIDELSTFGFQVDSTYRHVASGTIPVSSLGDICNCNTLVIVMPALAISNTGSVTSEGVVAMEADKVLKNLGFDGTGVRVGVIADSYNRLGGAKDDILSGDLPSADRIIVLDDSGDAPPRDEGRAMMQVIHDVAPGANLAFHTASGLARFAQGIQELATKAKCDVIVDDVFNVLEPAFQDGIIAQSVDKVRSMGVAYFSAIGNFARQSYEAPFVDSGLTTTVAGVKYRLHDFANSAPSGQPDVFQTIYLPNSYVPLVFQWDEPFVSASGPPGASSDLAIFLFDSDDILLFTFDSVNVGGDALEICDIDVAAFLRSIGKGNDPGYRFQIGIGLGAGKPPGRVKTTIFAPNGEFIDYRTNSGTGYGHCVASGSAAVAAAFARNTPAFGVDPPIVQPFSSAAGTPILIGKNGQRLPKPDIRRQPRFTGPDGAINTFYPTPENPIFFGTSAAAPHVAAVAALMLEANPALGPFAVYGNLERTAIDMSDPSTPGLNKGFDFRTGHGFVNASAVVEQVQSNRRRNLRSGTLVEGSEE